MVPNRKPGQECKHSDVVIISRWSRLLSTNNYGGRLALPSSDLRRTAPSFNRYHEMILPLLHTLRRSQRSIAFHPVPNSWSSIGNQPSTMDFTQKIDFLAMGDRTSKMLQGSVIESHRL